VLPKQGTNELIEYDLSGKKLKYVCTWVPIGGDE